MHLHILKGHLGGQLQQSPSHQGTYVAIKQSKTDPFRKGVYIYLGLANLHTCPANGMLTYLAVRGIISGPLFVTEKGMPLTRQYSVAR